MTRSGPPDDLDLAVEAVRHAIDRWAEAVRAAGAAHPGDLQAALDHPPLGVAEDAWDVAMTGFQEAAGAVLGVVELDEDDLDELDDDGPEVDALQVTVTTVVEGDGDLLGAAQDVAEGITSGLRDAGFRVASCVVQVGPPDPVDDQDDDDEDEAAAEGSPS